MLIPIRYNIRYLITRWTGTVMIAGTFALVVAVFIIVMSLARGIERALTTTAQPLNAIIIRPGAQSEGQSSIQIPRYPIIRAFPEFAQNKQGNPLVVPEVVVIVNKPKEPDGKPSNLQIRGVHLLAFEMRPDVRLTEGRLFRPGMREAIVSKTISRRFQNMRIGDKPHLGRSRVTIVGIFDAQGTAYDSEMWTDYRELMQEFDRGAYSSIIGRMRNPGDIEVIQKRLDADNRLKLTAKTEQKYYEEQTSTAAPLKAFGIFLAVMMSIGACFAGMNTMYASVAGRVREIGTLRVLGFTPISILISFLIESIALSLVGGMLGCLLSLPINGLATGTTNFQTFSEIVFYFTITPDLMLMGLVFALFMGTIGGILPAITAARQPVLSALRQV